MMQTISIFEAPETPLIIPEGVLTPDAFEQPNGTKKTYIKLDGDDDEALSKLIEETHYTLGKIDGMQYKWHLNGALAFAGDFKAGKPIGTHYLYYENGNKFSEFTYEDGVRNGTAREWYMNGSLHKDGTFKDGKIHGMYFEYSSSGAIMTACFFDNGALVRRAF